MSDPYNLQRFVDAQNPVYERVRRELRAGRKETHWMWFIFPQLQGLGQSEMAIEFGISSRQEADEYLIHSILGMRLRECTNLVNMLEGRSINQIFGSPDDLKFRSSISLFATVSGDNQIFREALQKYFGGELDPRTVERL